MKTFQTIYGDLEKHIEKKHQMIWPAILQVAAQKRTPGRYGPYRSLFG